VLRAARGVSTHSAFDRLIRGRIWIVLIAFALIGIVALQLLVLGLNADIGRALVREASLQRENAALSIEGSELAAGERVESQAARLGMQIVPIASLRFLSSDPGGDIARAAAALNTPVHGTSAGSGTGASATAAASSGSGATGAATSGTPGTEQSAGGEASATGAPSTEAASASATETAPGSSAGSPSAAPSTSAAPGSSEAQSAAPASPASSAGASTGTGEATPPSSAGGVGAPSAGASQLQVPAG